MGGVPRNARAEGMDRPVVRMSNTYIANGDWKLEEILEELGSGVYLAGSRGGQVSTGEGVFQFNAKSGYLVEDGEKTQATPGRVTVRQDPGDFAACQGSGQ